MQVSSSGPQARSQPPWIQLPNAAATDGFLVHKVGGLNLSVSLPGPGLVRHDLEDRASLKLRSGQILAPSGSLANDASRIRNGGSRIAPKQPPQLRASSSKLSLSERMSRSSSDPVLSLPGVRGTTLNSGDSSPSKEPKTPRTMRGMVRKTSTVQLQYFPGMAALNLSASLPSAGRWGVSQKAGMMSQTTDGTANWLLEGANAEMQGSAGLNMGARSPREGRKRVTWADRPNEDSSGKVPVKLNVVVKEGDPTEAQIRSKNLMDGLFKLRRVGGAESTPAAQVADSENVADASRPSTAPEEDEASSTLLNETLASCKDTEAELRVTERMLRECHDPVTELGGARHATTIVSGRTLSVVSRKAELCKMAEGYVNVFSAADAKRESLKQACLAGEVEVPDTYKNQKKIISSLVHRNAKGDKINPVEAEKAPFEVFAVSFGLAPEHWTLVKLRQLADDATEWWAEETLQEAHAGSNSDILKRMIDICVGFLGLDETAHPKLVQVKVIMGDRLAEKVLSIAEKLSEKDAQVVERSKDAQPEHARKVADQIDAELKQAVALGAPPKHAMLAKAKNIAVSFHIEEGARWALKASQFAKRKQEEDSAMAAKYTDKVPPVGPASERGDAIEKEIQACVKKGAPETHPKIGEATQIMKALRDLDGERKRMANREKRLAEQAAKKAEAEAI